MQSIEYSVYRHTLGQPGYILVATAIRGEMGVSLIVSRIIAGRFTLIKSIQESGNGFIQDTMVEERRERGTVECYIGMVDIFRG